RCAGLHAWRQRRGGRSARRRALPSDMDQFNQYSGRYRGGAHRLRPVDRVARTADPHRHPGGGGGHRAHETLALRRYNEAMDSASGSLLPKRGEGLPTPRRYLAIVAVALGTALAAIDASIVTVALPTLAHDLGVASSAAVLVVTVYQLILVMILLPCSALGKHIG